MNLSDLILLFGESLKVKNYSQRTQSDYIFHLRYFTLFLKEKEIENITDITVQTIIEFQRWIYYQPTKRGGIRGVFNQNTILSSVKRFCQFLSENGYLISDPSKTVSYSRQPHFLPQNILSINEIKKIIGGIDTTTLLGFRDRTILEVLYSTGIRRNELRGLCLNHLNLKQGVLHIHLGKGDRSRVVPLTKVSVDCLIQYIETIRPSLIQKEVDHQERVFVSSTGRPLDQTTPSYLLRKYVKQSKIRKHVTPHSIRHSLSVHLLQNNMNLRCLQLLLGHRSLSTTEKYLRLTIVDLKKAHLKHHPRNSF